MQGKNTPLLNQAINQYSVSTYWLEYILDTALAVGCDLTEDLVKLGITEEQLEQPTARIPLRVEHALLMRILERTDDRMFSLKMGERIRPGFMGELGYASMSSSTLREAIKLLLAFQPVLSDFIDITAEEKPGRQVRLFVTSAIPELPSSPVRTEVLFASAIIFGRWITGTQNNPMRIAFTHSCPDVDGAEQAYQQIFRCPVEFNQPRNYIDLDASLLDLPLQDADQDVHRIMRSRMQQAITNYQAKENLMMQVQAEIQRQLIQGHPSLERVADALGIKPWTLRRRLRVENSDFSTLLEGERKQIAREWLINSDHSIQQIASDLGYSEQSAFNRAFKRWFQCTPVEYRQQNRQQED